jgi:ABC-type phosphate/phosphonate transport system substrate-binding protein
MKRRAFLAGLTLLSALPLLAHAGTPDLSVGIYPGTGTADMFRDDFRTLAKPFANALAGALGRKPSLTMFRTLKSINRSLDNGRLDLYFAPPTVAVAAFNKGYVPIARVKDLISVVLVRRKGANVTAIALTEKQSLPDVLGRYVLKQKNESATIFNVKTQKDVILAMERDYAQAGGLGAKPAKALVENGKYEIWYRLPISPGFTLVASNQLSESDKNKLRLAVESLKPEIIQEMQKAIIAKLGSFVDEKGADYKTLEQSMKAAGYI